MANLEERVASMKREVDALQVAASEKQKPWYATAPTVVSIVALVFSFGTTAFSYKRSVDQEIADTRGELRGVLQRLVELPKEAAVNMSDNEHRPQLSATIGGFINQEGALLVAQAAGMIASIPEHMISAGEYYSMALAYQNAYYLGQAGQHYDLAYKRAQAVGDFNTEVAALRSMAFLNFVGEEIYEGRSKFRSALDIFARYPRFDSFTKASTNVVTLQSWSHAELAHGELNEARSLHAKAEELLDGMFDSPATAELRGNLDELRRMLSVQSSL